MSRETPRLLVAGIGNIFLGDDAFGGEVLRRLRARSPLPGVELVDFGIRGLDLVYALLEGYDFTILVDVMERGGPPGTLYVLEPEEPDDLPGDDDARGMNPARALSLTSAMGVMPGKLILVGCEPSPQDPEADPGSLPGGLSDPVALAVGPAADRILALIHAWLKKKSLLAPAPASTDRQGDPS